jgi:hypothetical protein
MNVRLGASPAKVCSVGPGTNPPSTATSVVEDQAGPARRRSGQAGGSRPGCRRAGRRQQQPAGAAAGVGGDLGQLHHIAELAGLAELARTDRAGVRSASDTSRSLSGSPRCRCWIWVTTRWQRPGQHRQLAGGTQLGPGATPSCRAAGLLGEPARLPDPAAQRPRPPRRSAPRPGRPAGRSAAPGSWRSPAPACRSAGSGRPPAWPAAQPTSQPAAPPGPTPTRLQRQHPIGGIADVGLHHGGVDAHRAGAKRRSRCALPITTRVRSATTSGPSRRTSLRTVAASGTRQVSGSRQNRRRCSQSGTSRTRVSYPSRCAA